MPFHWRGRVRAIVDGSEENGCLHWNQGRALRDVPTELKGPLGHRVRMGLSETSIIAQLGGSLRDTRDTWGVSNEAMAGIVPEPWLEWDLGEEWDRDPRPPEADMLAAHDAVTTSSRKA